MNHFDDYRLGSTTGVTRGRPNGFDGVRSCAATPKFGIVALGLAYVLLAAPAAFVLARRKLRNT